MSYNPSKDDLTLNIITKTIKMLSISTYLWIDEFLFYHLIKFVDSMPYKPLNRNNMTSLYIIKIFVKL